jgi:prepilin-type N-terminal cleavage/methylation domain-containing protein
MMRSRRARFGHDRCGFTMIELSIGLVLIAIIMAAMGSAVLVASRVTLRRDDPLLIASGAAMGVDDLARTLPLATDIAELSPTAITFTTPDQTGDGEPDTYRYAWSGTAGEPCTRKLNDGPTVIIVEGVLDLALAWTTRTVQTSSSHTGSTTSPELLLAKFEGWPGLPGADWDYDWFSESDWLVEQFTINEVSLPSDVIQVRITRLMLRMMRDGTGQADVSVAIHRTAAPGDPLPQAAPIGTPVVIDGAALPTAYAWREIPFSDVVVNERVDEFAMVIKGFVRDPSCLIQYRYETTAPANGSICRWTGNAGQSWQPNATQQHRYDVLFYVYGIYQTETTTVSTSTAQLVQNVTVRVQAGSGAAPPRQTTVQLLNGPEAPGPG